MPIKNAIEVTIRGEKRSLARRLGALQAVNDLAGGLNGAFDRLRAGDFNAVVMIFAAGLDIQGDAKAVQQLRADIFETGVVSMLDPAIEYINLLAKGGQTEDDVQAKDGKPGK